MKNLFFTVLVVLGFLSFGEVGMGQTKEEPRTIAFTGGKTAYRLSNELLHLTDGCKNDIEKLERIFKWMKQNLAYENLEDEEIEHDTKSMFITRKTADCGGYAEIFHILCDLNEIRANTRSGYLFGKYHGWSHVEVKYYGTDGILYGKYYNIDVTNQIEFKLYPDPQDPPNCIYSNEPGLGGGTYGLLFTETEWKRRQDLDDYFKQCVVVE